jgi:hypothetical protein
VHFEVGEGEKYTIYFEIILKLIKNHQKFFLFFFCLTKYIIMDSNEIIKIICVGDASVGKTSLIN